MSLEDKEQVLGILQELNNLFAEQTAIINKYSKQEDVIQNADKLALDKVEKDFQFLSHTLKENMGKNSINQFIGRMLIDARKQADEIVANGKKQEDVVVDAEVSVVSEETPVAVVEEERTQQLEETKKVHNKYIASLDNIVQEIDQLLGEK